MMQGTDLAWFARLRSATRDEITAAGGITTMQDIEALQNLKIHSALGAAPLRRAGRPRPASVETQPRSARENGSPPRRSTAAGRRPQHGALLAADGRARG